VPFPALAESEAAIRIFPRPATLVMFSLANRPLPKTVQVFPPSVDRITPMSKPPRAAKLLVRALPAMSVCREISVGSNSSAPIESDGRLSVNGVHVGFAAVAFNVLQTPPLTAPM
jgi:hypothetical protein